MLLLIPFFILVFLLCYVYGLLPFILLKKPLPSNPITPVLVGFALLGLLSQWFLLGGAINLFVLLVLVVGAFAATWRYGFYYQTHSANIWRWMQAMGGKQIATLLAMLLIILYQSALPTKIHDMATYYLQTLQWMQKFGAVPGLANLYPALGLGSAWHSLLSIFQVPGLPPFYALNGILVFSVFLWLFFQFLAEPNRIEISPNPAQDLQARLYKTKHNHRFNKALPLLQKIYLIAYSLLLFPLAFLYLTAPSPDLPLLVFAPLLCYFVVLDTSSLNPEIKLLLACFLFALKPPALLGISLGAFAVIQSFGRYQPQTLAQIIDTERKPWQQKLKLLAIRLSLAAFFLTPVLGKNWLQSGYLLYPLGNLGISLGENIAEPKWQVPADWNKAYRSGIIAWGYSDKPQLQEFKGQLPNTSSRLFLWLNRAGYKGFMNKMLLLNVLLGAILFFLISQKRLRAALLLLISLSVIEYFFLSQYRLMLPTALSLFGLNCVGVCFWLLASGFWHWGGSLGSRALAGSRGSRFLNGSLFLWGSRGSLVLRGVLVLVVGIYFVLAFVPMSVFRAESRNKSITQTDGFKPDYLLQAHTNYTQGKLDSTLVSGMTFYYYTNKNYTWNAPIPAQSISHTRFLFNHFGYQVKPLGQSPGEGFYMSGR